jgi:hypothetical protein
MYKYNFWLEGFFSSVGGWFCGADGDVFVLYTLLDFSLKLFDQGWYFFAGSNTSLFMRILRRYKIL